MPAIGSAFLVLTLLIAALGANGVYQLGRLQVKLNRVVALHDHKIDVVIKIQMAAQGRADRLLRMAIEKDPFARDQIYLEFNRFGFLVGSGRQELEKSGLTPEERRLSDALAALIQKIMPMQEKVTGFLERDQIEDAQNVLIAEGIPLQEQLHVILDEMRGKMQQAKDGEVQQVELDYRKGRLSMLLFGVPAIILGLVLAWVTLGRLRRHARVIEEQRAQLEDSLIALEVEASHDAMTGLCNRKLFYDRLKQAMLQAKRYNRMVGVLFIDLDNFKTVNDLYGHHVGDALLAEVAKRLLCSVRESDTVARAGGDEFLILLGNLSRGEDCETTIDKIEDALESKANILGAELMISASIGYAVYPEDGISEEELIRAAEAAMYHIKHGHPKAH